jgi:hypothetical protein
MKTKLLILNTEVSWEAGKDGTKPGIIMKSNEKTGDKQII